MPTADVEGLRRLPMKAVETYGQKARPSGFQLLN